MQFIGLTGGISTGKSTVSNILKENGFEIIDADKISRDQMDSDPEFQNVIIKAFGKEILDQNGVIDRTVLGNIIFADPAKRALLNKLSHPRVLRKIITQLIKLRLIQRKPLVVLDAPLLYETKIIEYFCYPIIVVFCEDA